MMETEALIYDLDGVIVDSRESNLAYYNELLRHVGLPPVGPEQMELIMTRTSQEVMESLLDDPALIRAAQEFEKTMDNERIIALIRLEPYARETLQALTGRYRTAIATNRGKSLSLVLQFHRLGRYFDLAVGSAQVGQPKPHPMYLEIILQEFSLSPGQALYIGDAEVDAQLAAAVGVPFLAYKNPRLTAWAHLKDHRDIWNVLE
jgi:HAD superfamily hydrolase (TIGR01549 family)